MNSRAFLYIPITKEVSNELEEYDNMKHKEELETLYSVTEAAAYFKTSKRLVRIMIKSGELEAMKVGREWRIPESAIRTYVESRRSS